MRKLNVLELTTVGRLLFGLNWKRDIGRALGLSPRARTVDKMANGSKAISANVRDKLIQELHERKELIRQAIQALESPTPTRIGLIENPESAVVFDECGIRTIDRQDLPESINGVALLGVTIAVPMDELGFHSMSIAVAASERSKSNDTDNLVDAINLYFDTSAINDQQWLIGTSI